MGMSQPKVLYILGYSRCGSTLLGNILGEVDGLFSAGEIRFLWERALQGRRCGCGSRLTQCDVWGRVLSGPGAASAEDVVSWQREVVRLRHMRRILRSTRPDASPRSALDRFVDEMDRVYRELGRITSARVIVDTSKAPSNAAALRLIPDLRVSFLHLVRDPRAVVFSQLRPKANPDEDEAPELRGPPLLRSSMYWTASNYAADAVRRALPSAQSMLVRYEDFVEQPRSVIERIVRAIEESGDLPFDGDRLVRLGIHHTVTGNPDRFRTGLVEIRFDDRWLGEMPTPTRAAVTALTIPLLGRYRYPFSPGSRTARIG
jgi:hypothetical protein